MASARSGTSNGIEFEIPLQIQNELSQVSGARFHIDNANRSDSFGLHGQRVRFVVHGTNAFNNPQHERTHATLQSRENKVCMFKMRRCRWLMAFVKNMGSRAECKQKSYPFTSAPCATCAHCQCHTQAYAWHTHTNTHTQRASQKKRNKKYYYFIVASKLREAKYNNANRKLSYILRFICAVLNEWKSTRALTVMSRARAHNTHNIYGFHYFI